MQPGSWFRGRRMHYDPDAQAIEQARQRWVYEHVENMSELAMLNPAVEYERHRARYVETGELRELRAALEYVTCP